MQNPYNRYQKNGASTPKKEAAKAAKPQRPIPKKGTASPKSRAKSVLPMGYILLSLIGLAGSFYVFNYTDEFLSGIRRIEVSFSSVKAEDAAKTTGSKTVKEENNADLPVGASSGINVGDSNLTMKKTSIYSALQDKQRELDKKERQLALLEEDLHKQKVEIEKQLKEMKEMRRNISSKLDKKVAADQESVDKLVGVYSSMKPQNAATILANIDEQLAIKVLAKMKKQSAAAILDYVEPKKAQTLSEMYAGLKK